MDQRNFDKDLKYNIIDITFAYADTKEIEDLKELKKLHDKL